MRKERMSKGREPITDTGFGLATLKPEGGAIHYDGGENSVFEGDGMGGSSYYVEMCIEPNGGFIPDIRDIKQAIDDHIIIANPKEKDDYIYELMKALVGDYITKDMI